MSIKEAKIIIDEYGLNTDEDTIEIVLEAVNKFGNAKNVLLEGLKPEYKYLKKLSKLLAMLDVKQTFDIEAEEIAVLMYDIYRVVSRDSQTKGEDFLSLLRRIDVRQTFKPTKRQLWVIQYLGGRELIAKINLQDPNQLNRRILNALEKYNRIPELSENLQIENNLFKKIDMLK
ncbi:MAG: hypothetical protein J7L21_04070 [Sulfurimonas sp.]|nr:hypothetical protein [Sulfurimonas sp.]